MLWTRFVAWACLTAATNAAHIIGYPRVALANATTSAGPTTSAGSTTSAGPTTSASAGFNLSSYCDAQRTSFFATYNSTGRLFTSTETDYVGFDASGSQNGPIVTQSYTTRTFTFTEPDFLAYGMGGAKPPCCNRCQLRLGTIAFYFWPDLASATQSSQPASGGPITAVAPNGFIYTSPSVYMAFSSLYATNFCGTVGEVWRNTTIGFLPDEISTINGFTIVHQPNYTTTIGTSVYTVDNDTVTQPPPSPLTYSDIGQNCSTVGGYVYFPDDPQNDLSPGDPCHPVVAVPQALVDLQDAWKNAQCTIIQGGAYDPPVALTVANVVAGPTLPSAQPGSTSTPSSPSPTSALSDVLPTTTSPRSTASNSATLPGSQPPATSPNPPPTSETTVIIGGGSSGNTPPNPSNPAPGTTVIGGGGGGGNTPSRPSNSPPETTFVIGGSSQATPTSENGGGQPGGTNTQAGGQPPPPSSATFTVVAGTTNSNGQSTVVTQVTVVPVPAPQTIVQQSTQPGGGVVAVTLISTPPSDGSAGPAESVTVLVQTTLADGSTTVASVVTTLDPAGEIPAPSITVGQQTVQANSDGGFVIAPGTTLSEGGTSVTISGTAYAVKTNSAGQTVLVIGTVPTTTGGDAIGSYIMGGLGQTASGSGDGSSTSTGGVVAATGAGAWSTKHMTPAAWLLLVVAGMVACL